LPCFPRPLSPEQLEELLRLTDKNLRTLDSVLRGESAQEMSLRCCITHQTGRARRKALYKRLGVEGERGVLRWAVERGLVTGDEVIERIVDG